MRAFLNISIALFFTLSFYFDFQSNFDFLPVNQDSCVIFSQKKPSINTNTQREELKGLTEFFEESDDDDDDRNYLNIQNYYLVKSVNLQFNWQYFLADFSIFQIKNAFRYARCIHFHCLLI